MEASELHKDLDRAMTLAQEFAKEAKGTFVEAIVQNKDGARLAALVRRYEEIQELFCRIMSFAELLHSLDVNDPMRSKFYSDTHTKIIEAMSLLQFFELELNSIDHNTMDSLYDACPELSHYRPWIRDVATAKPHQLSDELERLFIEKSITSSAGWSHLFDETISSLRFTVDDEELTIEPTLNLLWDPDEEKRKKASQALSRTLKGNLRLFTCITNTLAKDKEIYDRWHNFEDVADSRHLSNHVERQVIEALVSAVESSYSRLSHRYYALKAKWMGKPHLEHWDRNAPLPEKDTRLIPWSEAEDIVFTAYEKFSPSLSDCVGMFFGNNWIDAPVKPGKSPGGFSHPVVPSVHPFILMNYQGKTRDVATLAHELGHGVHQFLSGSNGFLMSRTPLTLSETAAVFGEMLTFDVLLERASTVTEKKLILASKVEDMLNTVIRQITFYSFERLVHTERKRGELTLDRLCEIWMQLQGDSYGPAVKLGDGYEAFWAYIPHFIHSPFYVYAYAFGHCLANSFYTLFHDNSELFRDKYIEFLKAGGTRHHKELLASFGFDPSSVKFWSMGLEITENMITELEAMG